MVIIQFFFYSGVSIGNFQKIANFNNIVKFVNWVYERSRISYLWFYLYFMFKINFSFITFVIVFMLYVLHILSSLLSANMQKQSTTETTNFGFTYGVSL